MPKVTYPSKKVVRETGVLIIGSGALGSVYARILVDGGYQVTMVDVGPQLSTVPGDHLRNAALFQKSPDSFGGIIDSSLEKISVAPNIQDYDTLSPSSFNPYSEEAVVQGLVLEGQNTDQDASTNLADASTTYAVGGMVTHWTCAIPRPTGSQLMKEIPEEELNVLYDEAEILWNLHKDIFIESPLNNVVKKHLSDGGFNVQPLPMAAEAIPETGFIKYSGASEVLGDELLNGRLKDKLNILSGHLCTRLNWTGDSWSGYSIESATVMDFERDEEIEFKADKFVVACNTILTPQLLFNSDIWRDHLPALGRHLMMQPKFWGQISLTKEIVWEIAELAGPYPPYPKEDPIPFSYDLRPPNLTIPPDPDNGRVWHTQITRDPSNEGSLPPGADQRLIVQMRWFAPTLPNWDNEVTFSKVHTDKFGMPQPTFHFTYGEQDAKWVADMEQDIYKAAERLGGFFPGFEAKLAPPGNSLHYSGTVRIGDDRDTSVCDTYSKAWLFDNLYLAGNGAIPNPISVNPTLTSTAIGIRAAQKIVKDG